MDKNKGVVESLASSRDENKGELELLADSINNQQVIVRQIIQIKKDMEDQEKRIDQKVTRTENLVEKIAKEVTINYDEQREIQARVSYKAKEMTQAHESQEDGEYSTNLFRAWKGLFISRIYQKLKAYMNVVRYTAIQREKYDRALEFIDAIEYQDFKYRELLPTPSIVRIIEEGA